ncbi:CoA transferase [Nocardiopsis quinghaiensis]|uniref:CoA transferase n=1 Tax=Nocardiopsis quinghaiensis TaxID=464995 RepID=UPI001CC232E9|nr:CoA transferase [Nocardiopsis quinghaiensis]
MDVTPRSADAAVPLPLAGAAARTMGDSVALRVASARLEALGCAVLRLEGEPPPDAPAGWIGLVGVSGGEGVRTRPPVPAGCAIGWSGPVAAPLAGERDVQAACGLAHLHGRARGQPRFLGVDYASVCAGVLAAQAVAASALALARGGPALSASVSAAQAALLAAGPHVAAVTAPGAGSAPPAGGGASAGGAASPSGRRRAGEAPVPPFRSADGARFEIETLDAEVWLRFWTDLGTAPDATAAGWPPFQSRFATAVCPLPPELPAAVSAMDFDRVRSAAFRAGMSISPVRTAEAAEEPAPASEWRLYTQDGTGAPVPGPAPLDPGATAPLSGLRVVEATNRIQGPLAGLLLAMLGAEVVRVEPPGGDPMRGVPPMAGECSARFLALNRGKDAVEADLRTATGRRTARDLAATADVLLYNWPPGRAERFGLGPDDLADRAPALVHVHADGWGGEPPEPGALATDYLVQAHGGVADLLTGPGEEPAPSLLTLTDVLGGIIAAEGAVAALLAGARTGAGARARTALSDAARLLRSAGRGTAPGDRGGPAPVEDLAAMAAAPEFTGAFDTVGGASCFRAPWSFAPATARPVGAPAVPGAGLEEAR